MPVHTGAVSFGGAGNLSATVRARQLIRATFAGAGNLSANLREQKQRIEARFAGAGNLSANLREQKQRIAVAFGGVGTVSAYASQKYILNQFATFSGAGSLSAVDDVIGAEVSILSTSFFQAIADRGLADMVGDPKARLVLAVEINIVPLG